MFIRAASELARIFMKLRSERVENGDFSGPMDELKNRLSGRNRIEVPSDLSIDFGTEKAVVSAPAVAGLRARTALWGWQSGAHTHYR
jgi:hypothetical protein